MNGTFRTHIQHCLISTITLNIFLSSTATSTPTTMKGTHCCVPTATVVSWTSHNISYVNCPPYLRWETYERRKYTAWTKRWTFLCFLWFQTSLYDSDLRNYLVSLFHTKELLTGRQSSVILGTCLRAAHLCEEDCGGRFSE